MAKNIQDEIYSELPSETRVMAQAAHTFSEALATQAQLLQLVVSNIQDIKNYFTSAHGGFNNEIANLKDADKELLSEYIAQLKDTLNIIDAQCDVILSKVTPDNQVLLDKLNNEITTKIDKLEKNLKDIIKDSSDSTATKILIFLLGSTGLLGIIIYLINIFINNPKITEETVRQILQGLAK